jgi:hypothetical protein
MRVTTTFGLNCLRLYSEAAAAIIIIIIIIITTTVILTCDVSAGPNAMIWN